MSTVLSRQERFWRWLRNFSQRMMHDEWMHRRKHDRQCPNCKRWFGDAGGWDSLTDETAMIERITCEACGHTSRWWMGDMMPVSIPWPSSLPSRSSSLEGEGCREDLGIGHREVGHG